MIYAHGLNTLCAYANRGVKRHIGQLAGAVHHQHDGDSEVFRFPIEQLAAVAAILKPKRRRTLDPDRARAIGSATFYGAQGGQAAQKRTIVAGEGVTLGSPLTIKNSGEIKERAYE